MITLLKSWLLRKLELVKLFLIYGWKVNVISLSSCHAVIIMHVDMHMCFRFSDWLICFLFLHVQCNPLVDWYRMGTDFHVSTREMYSACWLVEKRCLICNMLHVQCNFLVGWEKFITIAWNLFFIRTCDVLFDWIIFVKEYCEYSCATFVRIQQGWLDTKCLTDPGDQSLQRLRSDP